MDTLILDTADRIFADHCDKPLLDAAEQGRFPEHLLTVIRDNGFHLMAMRDSGIALAEAFAVIRLAGRYALPLPLAELMLANRWLRSDNELASIGVIDGADVTSIPWGRRATAVIGISATGAAGELRDAESGVDTNMAGEPRDRALGGRITELTPGEDSWALLALSRVMLMAGALTRSLELTLQYATEREQFGRPISGFQAIQHHLALMAAETAAGGRAADAAAAAIGGERFRLEVAAAKTRVSESARIVAELAQQVHGAMGYTHEHQLHHFTRRLWAWRDEYGTESYWQEQLGRHVAAQGADAVWAFVATPVRTDG